MTQDSEALEILAREIDVLTRMLRKREEQVNEYAQSALRVAEANADLAARTARAEDELKNAKEQLGKANSRVKSMERSRSWRWTRFLRRGK
ncbi:unannotated protein [freshwater metagenome]|uniref:Unannotated protein n=1 Tax=freshwater metagenome TaxID=449393 RepID=A0A6J7GE91_9ZZZZ|nr:hypothetical protein [Actinomycetota bacterium]